MITGVEYRPFRLPFRKPLAVGGRVWEAREGYLVRLLDSSGQWGVGEWSEWPPQLPCIEPFAAETIQYRLGPFEPERDGFQALPQWNRPGFNFAMQTAWMDLRARLHGRPLCTLLNAESAAEVELNGLIGLVDASQAQTEAALLASRGIRCIKVKLGRSVFDDDMAVVEAVRRECPTVELRGDANGAWSPAEAVTRLRQLEAHEFSYVEEPVAGLAAIASLQSQTSIPLAADESLGPSSCEEAAAIPVWILKPSRLGGYTATQSVLEAADRADAEIVMTGVFESAVGTAAIAHLAAAWLPFRNAVGIDTAPLLAQDTAVALPFLDGHLQTTGANGLGVELRVDSYGAEAR
jgi:o-succinylbenzoate synthase